MKWKMGLPSRVEKREVPSGITPAPWVERMAGHRFVLGEAQKMQLGPGGRVSRSPHDAKYHRRRYWYRSTAEGNGSITGGATGIEARPRGMETCLSSSSLRCVRSRQLS